MILQTEVQRVEHIVFARALHRTEDIIRTEESIDIMLVEERERLAQLKAEVHTSVQTEISLGISIYEHVVIVFSWIEVGIPLVAFTAVNTEHRTEHQVHIETR